MAFTKIPTLPRWMLWSGLFVVAFLALSWPADALLTADSTEYLARIFYDPFHPHHLLWSFLLKGASLAAPAFGSSVDVAAVGQVVSLGFGALAVVFFCRLLAAAERMPRRNAIAWGILLMALPGFRAMAQETESYVAAIALLLLAAVLLFACRRTHYLLAALAFAAAVCVHQLVCLAAPVFLFAAWGRGRQMIRNAVWCCLVAGALTLMAYITVYRLIAPQDSFVIWLRQYSYVMPAFGTWRKFLSPGSLLKLAGGFASAVLLNPFTVTQKFGQWNIASLACWGSAVLLWAGCAAAAARGLFSRNPAYRFAAGWFIVVEVFTWYWQPQLLQMHVLALPGALASVAFCAAEAFPRQLKGSRGGNIPLLPVGFLLAAVIAQVLVPPQVGSVSLQPGRKFAALMAQRTEPPPRVLILYGYSQSWSAVIATASDGMAQPVVIHNLHSSRQRKADLTRATEASRTAFAAGGSVWLHQSLWADAEAPDVAAWADSLSQTDSVTSAPVGASHQGRFPAIVLTAQ